ncbi:MAG: hypothetical protein DLM55_11780 [Acidimicrobiales bacterium]|nr:MAG: hypothetical protein DLM55_11780 [Acidimicrobiales bacterium]
MNVGIPKKLSRLGIMGSVAACAALSAVIFTANPASADPDEQPTVKITTEAQQVGCTAEAHGQTVYGYCTGNAVPYRNLIVTCANAGKQKAQITENEEKDIDHKKIPYFTSVTCYNYGSGVKSILVTNSEY